jgi:hypothetical protein
MFGISLTSRAALGVQKFAKILKKNFLQNQRTHITGISKRLGIIGVPFGKGQVSFCHQFFKLFWPNFTHD